MPFVDILDDKEEPRIPLSKIIAAIEEEPEYPGKISSKIETYLNRAIKDNNIDLIVDLLRITVRLTKTKIKQRIIKIGQNNGN